MGTDEPEPSFTLAVLTSPKVGELVVGPVGTVGDAVVGDLEGTDAPSVDMCTFR
jgi:hypothetical protein